MTPEEAERLKAEHAVLLKEKADAEAAWNLEVRNSLHKHDEAIADIRSILRELIKENKTLEKMEIRLKRLEDFKLQAVAYWTAASTLVIVLWKVIEKFWK